MARRYPHHRLKALNLLASWEGKTEQPAGSNIFPPIQNALARLEKDGVKIPAWQRNGGFAWCIWACFVAYAEVGSTAARDMIEQSNAAYTMTVLDDAENERHGIRLTNRPLPGDIILFDFPAGDKVDHAGLMVDRNRWNVNTIEGNTSSGSLGSQSNGGGVYRRSRERGIVRAYIRVTR